MVFAVLICGCMSPAQEFAGAFKLRSVQELDLGSVEAWSPKWSPDAQWIAFSLPKSEGIALVRPDGRDLRVLTREPRSGYRFAWSPDGRQIAYRAWKPENGPRRYVIRAVQLATNEATQTDAIPDAQPPQWQRGPGGMRWVTHDGTRQIEGPWASTAQTAPDPTPPFVATRNRELWLEPGHGTNARKLTGVAGIRPTWDRGGRQVLVDASDKILISTSESDEPARELCVGQHPAWSPDGRWIVYQITRDHSHEPNDARQHGPDTLPHLHDDKTNHQIVDSDLWMIRNDGTGRHQLTRTPDVLESDPDWSADGNRIVCRDERTGRLRILEIERP
jgi:hypothetical protein